MLKEVSFINSSLSDWEGLGFKLGEVMKTWTVEEIKGLEDALSQIPGYILGNLDFSICLPIEDVKTLLSTENADSPMMKMAEIKAILEYRLKINK